MSHETAGPAAPGRRASGRRRVVAALGIVQIFAWGSSYYLLAVLAAPIAAGTGWPYAAVVGGVSLGLLVAGLAATQVGRAIDRHGGRPVLACSALLLACGLAGVAASPNLPAYFAAWLVLGLGMGTGLYDAAFSTLGRLYGREARSAITALTLWGGFASTICWPLSAFLVESLGWRGTCLAYAALHLAFSLPLTLTAIPHEPRRPPGPLPRPEPGPGAPPPLAHRRLVFGLLVAILTTGGAISALWSVHLLAILQATGVTLAAAVALGALVGPSQVGARLVEMAAGGRYHPIWTLTAATVLIAAGLGLLWAGTALPALALIAFGAGNGIWSIARGALPLALFGPEDYAIVMGRLATPSLIVQAIAPSLGAALMARLGAQVTLGVLASLALANILGVAALWLAARRSLAPAAA